MLPFAIKHNMNYSLKFVALIKNSLYMATKKQQKTANYIVRYGNIRVDESMSYHLLIGYTRSQIKAYARNFRLRYEIVYIAKIDYSI